MVTGQHLINYVQVLRRANICNLRKWQDNTIKAKTLSSKTTQTLY